MPNPELTILITMRRYLCGKKELFKYELQNTDDDSFATEINLRNNEE